ncbi:MAG: DUF86 domain-containing protein [Betaproteobacteria bacterium]|nr:DUF86 domain-containing protein [Betaproteobacteria bacterium]NBY70484.1 DUF86 domain-containing protein [Betaproteobacteria bacterium]
MSKADTLRLPDYLGHIVQAIDRILRYVDDMTEATFLQDEKTQDAVIRNFEIIGEASNNVRRYHPDFVVQHPEVPLNFAYEMRNALAHGYFRVDFEVVWKTIHADLPELRAQVAALIDAQKN